MSAPQKKPRLAGISPEEKGKRQSKGADSQELMRDKMPQLFRAEKIVNVRYDVLAQKRSRPRKEGNINLHRVQEERDLYKGKALFEVSIKGRKNERTNPRGGWPRHGQKARGGPEPVPEGPLCHGRRAERGGTHFGKRFPAKTRGLKKNHRHRHPNVPIE